MADGEGQAAGQCTARAPARLLTALRATGDGTFDPMGLACVLDHLRASEAVEVRYTAGVKPKDVTLTVDLEVCGASTAEAEARAASLAGLLDVGLDLACPHLRFGELAMPFGQHAPQPSCTEVRPNWRIFRPSSQRRLLASDGEVSELVALEGGLTPRPPLLEGREPRASERAILFDRLGGRPRLPIDPLLKALERVGQTLSVVFRIEAAPILAQDRRALRNTLRRLSYAPPHRLPDLIEGMGPALDYDRVVAWLQGWLAVERMCRCRCLVFSETPLAGPLVGMIGHLIYREPMQAAPLEAPSEALDLRGANPGALLPLYPYPSPRMVAALGFPSTAPRPPRFPAGGGIRIGQTDDGLAVHLAAPDRARHTYVIGATGTGKSTLLLNMIRQDMAAGDGVVVIDPHGDLFADARRLVPAGRVSDLVLVDFADFDHPVAINLLEVRGPHPEIQQNFICNELIRIFSRVLYRGVPEAFGPVFETYFRNALLLLMQGGGNTVTLVDVERVFADDAFREELLAKCAGRPVAAFWQGIAGKVTQNVDHSLKNMAPYIVSKLTQFTSNALIRPIICNPESSLDFRRLMDERRIVLVNLAKGLLGEYDSALLGMLLLGKVYLAAMGRANLARGDRQPVSLFIDEFQNLATDSLGAMMSEGRKFGLCMTLANQTLSQIDGRNAVVNLAGPILANAANLVVFRVGVPDAEMLSCWTRPTVSTEMLAQLPDYHAVARILHKGRPLPPFVFAADAVA